MDRHFSPELSLFSVSWLFSVGIFMMNDRDFHNEQVKIFMMNNRDFCDERWKFSDDRTRFL